ncbi:allophanate hydrolase [Humibacillus sp. DSM 29435]|uniref:5-oxoprolinase subunit PxpB n=1 Tax=Humibacillus sp. DSM 29435 TaxID=1869167 RepID=UPI0008729FB0|nr:5-oxoprolinase subunit PxpB [Humibacillus sp. DSM 29435]OFE17353.1 allophanate hydrolase [Humibacillus sp. DSM 29435]
MNTTAPSAVEPTLLSCGQSALLVELGTLDAVLAADAAVRSAAHGASPGTTWAGVVDIVPAAETLLVTLGSTGQLPALRRAVTELLVDLDVAENLLGDDQVVQIPVRYDGPDLREVARLCGLSPSEVMALHTATPWRVGFSGFAPGFAYLTGGDARLEVARRTEPRTVVPAGAVGLAGSFSGIYPRPSPGGWQLIGTTDATLWDVDRDPPALLQPGWSVQFIDSGAT